MVEIYDIQDFQRIRAKAEEEGETISRYLCRRKFCGSYLDDVVDEIRREGRLDITRRVSPVFSTTLIAMELAVIAGIYYVVLGSRMPFGDSKIYQDYRESIEQTASFFHID